MISIQHLHSHQLSGICKDWQDAVKDLVVHIATTKQYSYTQKYTDGTSQTFPYNTLKEKVYGSSELILESLIPDNSFFDVNLDVSRILLKEELDYFFADIWTFVGKNLQEIRTEVDRCENNRKRTSLYQYVYDALKGPFEELYKLMQVKMQDRVFDSLNIRTCPYCNRQYTFTLKPNKKGDPNTSPEFDHFYPKSIYPTLAISFYNLVPSCHCCNHGKGQKQLYVNPYESDFQGAFYLKDKAGNRFNSNDILYIKDEKDIHVGYQGSYEESEDVKTLGLDQLYSMHRDYVQEIIDKVNGYKAASMQDLIDSFQGYYNTPQQIYDFVWGKYLELSEQEKRPLSKFTKDLLELLCVKR